MKRIWYLAVLVLALGSLQPLVAGPPVSPGGEPYDPQVEATERVMAELTRAMRSMNVEEFASVYWEDALRIMVFPGGGRHVVEGRDAIAEQQAAVFREVRRREPDAFRYFTLPPVRVVHLPDRLPVLVYSVEESDTTQVFQFEERFGRIAISRHVEFIRELEPVEAPEEYA